MKPHLFDAMSTTSCPQGWSKHEFAMLVVAAKFLQSQGTDLVTDYGVTDEGDPWFVICDAEGGDVLVQFARIAGEYLACVPFGDYALTETGLNALLDKYLQSRCIAWPMLTSRIQPHR